MSKRQIRTELYESDWIAALDGKTVEEAIQYLHDYDYDCLLEEQCGYDGSYGTIASVRLETDEEEYARENAVAIEEAAKQKQREANERAAKEREDALLQSKMAYDVAVWAYLQKFPDSPHKDDMNNLYRAKMQLEKDGHGPNSSAMKGIDECLRRLESE